MGLKDRVLDFVAGWFGPTMDHPGAGGMTGKSGDRDTSDEPEATESDDEPES